MIQGHFQGQKVNFKVNWAKIWYTANNASNKWLCSTSFSCNFVWKIFVYDLHNLSCLRSSSRSKSQFQGQVSKNMVEFQGQVSENMIFHKSS